MEYRSFVVEQRLLGIVHAEELGIVGGQHINVLANAAEHAFLVAVDLTEEAGLIVVDGDGARNIGLEVLLGLN